MLAFARHLQTWLKDKIWKRRSHKNKRNSVNENQVVSRLLLSRHLHSIKNMSEDKNLEIIFSYQVSVYSKNSRANYAMVEIIILWNKICLFLHPWPQSYLMNLWLLHDPWAFMINNMGLDFYHYQWCLCFVCSLAQNFKHYINYF